jgi:hypothetical protein
MNRPAPFGQRQVIDFAFTGTYNVNEDGTLTAALTYTLPNGMTVDAEIDGIIRQAEVIDGVKIMTEGYGLERGGAVPSLTPGSLTTLPPRGCLTKRGDATLYCTVDGGSNAFEVKEIIDAILPMIRGAVE